MKSVFSDQRSAISGQHEVEEDPTPTQKIWRPVSDLDLAQQRAFQEMQAAMTRGDLEGAQAAFQRISEIEAEQMRAHQAARQYLLKKLGRA